MGLSLGSQDPTQHISSCRELCKVSATRGQPGGGFGSCRTGQAEGPLGRSTVLHFGVPLELEALVRRSLAKDPAARLRSAEEFQAALLRIRPLPRKRA
jgi:hypothetical protein